jgi:23S rRNA (adenine2503-C2)-methyltransferase
MSEACSTLPSASTSSSYFRRNARSLHKIVDVSLSFQTSASPCVGAGFRCTVATRGAADFANKRYQTYSVRTVDGVLDGEWSDFDEKLVRQSQKDADSAYEKSMLPVSSLDALKLSGSVDIEKLSAGAADRFNLLGLTLTELERFATDIGLPAYRGKQLRDHIYAGSTARSVDDLVSLPKSIRAAFVTAGVCIGRSTVHHVTAAPDGVVKLLLRLGDDRIVETVGIPATENGKNRLTACVSSQVGCPMRCSFCATGKGGFARNLASHEIVDQVLSLEEHFGKRVTNVVFMGMGEPLLNIPNVLRAYLVLNTEIGIGARHMTISTVGVRGSLEKLAGARLQSTLAVSLHAPSQDLREMIIPSAKSYPLDELLHDCVQYFIATGRRVTFEYTLLAGVNDSPDQAIKLAELLYESRLASHVNLIPYNPVHDAPDFVRPARAAVLKFQRVLEDLNIPSSIRQSRGLEAAAACGQLRNSYQKFPFESTD